MMGPDRCQRTLCIQGPIMMVPERYDRALCVLGPSMMGLNRGQHNSIVYKVRA